MKKTDKNEWNNDERRKSIDRREGDLDRLYRDAVDHGILLERRKLIRRKIDQYMQGELDLRAYILSCFESSQKLSSLH